MSAATVSHPIRESASHPAGQVSGFPAALAVGMAALIAPPALGAAAWLAPGQQGALAAAAILPATVAAAGIGVSLLRRAAREPIARRSADAPPAGTELPSPQPSSPAVERETPRPRGVDGREDGVPAHGPEAAGGPAEPPQDSVLAALARAEAARAPDVPAVQAAQARPAVAAGIAKAAVVIRLTDPTRARGLAGLLAADGYAATAADTTDELHALLNRDRVDLLVIEDALPGFLSGLDVVEMFRRELLRPQVVLLADLVRNGPRVRELRPAAALPAGSSIAEVADAVRGAAAKAEQVAFVAPAARRLVAAHGGLKPMPQLLVKLAGYLATDAADVSIPDLARDVSSDPAAAAELLRVINGASLGLRRRVASVADAVALLGPRRTVAIVVSGAAVSSANELLRGWAEPLRAWYHRRSALTAGAAQAFARFEGVSPDTAFLLGLLQDLGVAVQAEAGGERYAKTAERARSIAQLTLPLVERVELGYTHADVSAALLQRWGLPASLVGPVLAHHGDDGQLPKTERAFVRLMRIGEAVADLADHPCPQRRQALNRLLSAYPTATPEACRAAVAEAVARAVEASRLFAVSEPDPDTLRRLADELRNAGDGGDRSA